MQRERADEELTIWGFSDDSYRLGFFMGKIQDFFKKYPGPRIHSKSMHGFSKIHGYQHGYP